MHNPTWRIIDLFLFYTYRGGTSRKSGRLRLRYWTYWSRVGAFFYLRSYQSGLACHSSFLCSLQNFVVVVILSVCFCGLVRICVDWLPYICAVIFGFSNGYHFACVLHTSLKLGCITNFDILFIVMGFNSLIEIQFMVISTAIFGGL